MRLGPTDDCRHCGKRIMLCRVRGGAWKPFELDMVPNTPEVTEGYLPIRNRAFVALVPTAEIGPRRLAGVRWLAARHRCPEGLRATAGRRREHSALAHAINELLDQWQPPTQTEEAP